MESTSQVLHDRPITSIDPWSDSSDFNSQPDRPLQTPDPESLDKSIVTGLGVDSPVYVPPKVSHDILTQFDPLANFEEEAAREAWITSVSNPPPPSTPEPPPEPPNKDAPEPPLPSSSSSFPSFAALARSFAIPTLSRSRPVSLDAAKAVPSPAVLSSLEHQQDTLRDTPPPNDHTEQQNKSDMPSPADSKDEIPFDFQKFLDQMKSRNAEPVSKYLRSFLSNFAKRTFTVNDQVKIINDFLNFIAGQMRASDIWKNASDAEFDNAMEGMEKLVMNRLYEFTFTPQVVHCVPPRPITADDLERDRVLSQRIALFGWIEGKHLDLPEGDGSAGFLMFAQQELLKINHYKAPRDKLICILNCCKVIFGLIRHLQKEEGADSFIPILIFVVLKANPDHLLSNVEFINRFRNPGKLQSEAGYYLSSLMGAVSFIETMDHTSLSNIDREEFEKNVEDAIEALPDSDINSPFLSPGTPNVRIKQANRSPHAGEESAQPLSIATPSQTLSDDAKRILQKTGDTISKPLNAIGRIFSEALDGAEEKLTYLPGPFAPLELGREQRAEQSGSGPSHWAPPGGGWSPQPQSGSPVHHTPRTPQVADGSYSPPVQTPYKPRVKRMASSSYSGSPGGSPGFVEDTPSRTGPYANQPLALEPYQQLLSPSALPPHVQSLVGGDHGHISRTPTPNLDLSGVEAQIDAATEHAAAASRETLLQIFPGMDREVIELVLEANTGDLGKSIEALLEMCSGS